MARHLSVYRLDGERKQSRTRVPNQTGCARLGTEQLQKTKADLDMTFESFIQTYTADMQSRIKENNMG